MIYQIALLATVLASASARLFTEDSTHQKYLWESFKSEFHRNYESMEVEMNRFQIFLENLKIADIRNNAEMKVGGSAIHGITRFSDMSQSEFQSTFLKTDISLKPKDDPVQANITQGTTATVVNWAGIYTTPVKNQAQCGGCWAFSAAEQIESDAMRVLKLNYILSPEQIIQCDTGNGDNGCNGGYPSHAYTYVHKAGGIEQESDYPYTSGNGKTGTCSVNSSKFKVTVSGYTQIKKESDMGSYVQSTGPLSICVDASSWSSYKGGIMTSCSQNIDHAVQAVGVYPVSASQGGYWIIRNSWGVSWGESGYIRLAYGQNTCGLTYSATYTTGVAKV